MKTISLYFTSNQETTKKYLGTTKNAYQMIAAWGKRLKHAMGEKEILSRSCFMGGEFRPPTFRTYAESLDRSMWTVCDEDGRKLHVVPYNHIYDGWKDHGYPPKQKYGFMAAAINSYEFAYDLWDWTSNYHPDLMDDGTFGTWFELLPEPASVILRKNKAIITWDAKESRVFRSSEMGRYCLSQKDRRVEAEASNWRIARAEAYVLAWEKMAANEPADRYESVILAEQKQLKERWSK